MPDATFRNLFGADRDVRWVPAADPTNAPPGVLLRADNLAFDEVGTPCLRRGTLPVVTSLSELHVRSMITAELRPNDTPIVYRYAGTDGYVFQDGVALTDMPGIGEIAFGRDLNYVYFAKKDKQAKADGTRVYNWSLAKPLVGPTVVSSALNAVTIATCNSGESPGFAVNEGVQAQDTGFDGTANGAVKLTPVATTGRASSTKTFASDQDYNSLGGIVGGTEDLFDILVYIAEPERVETVTVMFGLNTTTDAFRDDYYYFDFKIKNAATVDLKSKGQSEISSLTALSMAEFVADPSLVARRKSPSEVIKIIRDNQDRQTRRRERKDAQAASPAWTHLSVTRGQFNRVGGTAGRNWSTVRAIKVVYQAEPGSTGEFRIDNPTYVIGGPRSYTGKYRFLLQWVRNVAAMIDKSPPSEISAEITVQQSGMTITIPQAAIAARDPQANEAWLYIYGGNLDTWYRCAVTGVTPGSSGIRLDEYAASADGAVDINDRARYITHDFGFPGGVGSQVIQVQLLRSETELLIENEQLEIGLVQAPSNITHVEGPINDRMVATTSEGFIYWTGQRAHSTFNIFHAGMGGPDPVWCLKTASDVYIGTKRDIMRITGTGNVDEFGIIDFNYEQLGVAHPPVDECAWVQGNSIIYRSADGLMMLTGTTVMPFPITDLEPLWRGKSRHGIKPLNTSTGRFRMIIDNQVLTYLAPEGEIVTSPTDVTLSLTNILHRYDMQRQRWMRHVFPFNIVSIHREFTGGVLVGTDDGRVILLDTGVQDNGADIAVEIWTRFDDGTNPLIRKFGLTADLRADTGGRPMNVAIHKNGSDVPSVQYIANCASQSTYSKNIAYAAGEHEGAVQLDAITYPGGPLPDALGEFYNAQYRFTGSFYRLYIYLYNILCRLKPQEVMAVDTGIISAPAGQDFLHVKELEITLKSGTGSITVESYFDGQQYTPITITLPFLNEVVTVRTPLPRVGSYGLQGRFLVYPTGVREGINVGFECYRIRGQIRGAGNKTGFGMKQIYPVGAST